MANPVSVPLLDHFADFSDSRQHAKVLYPLPEILLLVLSATIAGADDFVETTPWGDGASGVPKQKVERICS